MNSTYKNKLKVVNTLNVGLFYLENQIIIVIHYHYQLFSYKHKVKGYFILFNPYHEIINHK